MSEQNYISRQITVYKTDKKLIEFIDKLKPAPTDFYAHIHSFGDKDEEGVKQTSCIGIVLQDYSKGTGKQTIRVMANISPDEAEYILTQLQNKVSNFELKQEKIFGTPDKDGRARVTKLRVIRAETGKDGKKRTYPWYVEIGNGTGMKVKQRKAVFISREILIKRRERFLSISMIWISLSFSSVSADILQHGNRRLHRISLCRENRRLQMHRKQLKNDFFCG